MKMRKKVKTKHVVHLLVNMMVEGQEVKTTVYIDGFVKPFSVEDVKAFVSAKVAPINTEEHFFMNRGNTFCYVTYKSAADAKKAMDYMYSNSNLFT